MLSVAVLLGLGCAAGPRLFVSPQADITFYKKVAILPFTNLSSENNAGERVARAFTTELIIADRLQIVDPGEFRVALEKIGGEPNSQGHFDPDKVREAASKVGATGVIRGAVTEHQLVREGQDEVPALAVEVEMVDAATNNVVWRISMAKHAGGGLPVLGGGGTRTFGRLIEETCREMVKSLTGEAF